MITDVEFSGDYETFIKQKEASPEREDFILGKLYPVLGDKYENNGSAKGDYFHQDLLVARRIYENKPEKHIDVGSSVCGFVAHVASFREIIVLDIRPSTGKSHNITFMRQDFMSELDSPLIGACDSASSLHAMEHFGLGRYGDPVNYSGHLVGLNNLYKLLKKGGKLYFSVPIGYPQRVEFNAHRVFSVKYLARQFEGKFRIDFFSYVDNAGDLHENVNIDDFPEKDYGDTYGCGIFEMTKI
jgi:SAM-dependent methyltransferase